jgi:hypothetical protein
VGRTGEQGLKNCTFQVQERIKEAQPKAIILSGGPNSVHETGSPQLPEGLLDYVEVRALRCSSTSISCGVQSHVSQHLPAVLFLQ